MKGIVLERPGGCMKNKKYQKSCVPTNVNSSFEEMPEEIIGDKQIYNWLYQQEEEDYYLCEKILPLCRTFCKEHYL